MDQPAYEELAIAKGLLKCNRTVIVRLGIVPGSALWNLKFLTASAVSAKYIEVFPHESCVTDQLKTTNAPTKT